MRFLACLSVAMTVLASTASAQVATWRYHLRDDSFGTVEGSANRVAANGRCSGISFGTGARRCDSPSGGPSGGISSRN